MTTKIRTILVIDDDPIDRESYIRALTLEAGAKTEIIEAETGAAGLAVAAARHIDCVLLDYNLPDMDGLEVLQQLRDRPTEAEIPVIMLTGAGSEQVQIRVRLNAVPPPDANQSWIRVTNATNPGGLDIQVNPQVDQLVTLDPGNNTLQAIADDPQGNRGQSLTCTIALADVAIVVDAPVDDGQISGQEPGVTPGVGTATFDFCGTVSDAGAAITLDIDSGTQVLMTTATGTTWCVNGVVLSEGSHTYTITAVAGPKSGVLSNQPLNVDVTPPTAPTLTTWTAISRLEGMATWTAGGGQTDYITKWSSSAITDGNFNAVPDSATEAASAVSTVVSELRAGTSYWFAIAARDAAGNRSTAQIMGPITPAFDRSGAIAPALPENADDKHLGWSIAFGKFNSDNYSDVAVAAPFETVGGNNFAGVIYVYLGGPNGLSTTPTYRITSPVGFALMGYGLTALQWDNDAGGRDDLAIGSPYTNTIYVIPGGTAFDPPMGATLPITIAADQASALGGSTITLDGTASYLAGANLGWSLATARFDGDSRDDLIAGVPSAGGARGGLVIIYGGASGDIALSDVNAANMNNAQARLFKNPETLTGALFGNRVTNLGPTTRATDDIAVSRVADLISTDGDRVYVLRSAAGNKPAPGSVVVERAFFPARDLSIAPVTADATTYFGDSLGTIASVNGDGIRDIVIGSRLHESAPAANNSAGMVFIVNGNSVGAKNVATSAADPTNGIRLLQIGRTGSDAYFGSMVLNNAMSSNPDIDNDGLEDLVILGGLAGTGTGVNMWIWFGDALPTADTTSASAHHIIAAPSAFQGITYPARIGPLVGAWVGDTNGDGFEDICWADHNASTDGGTTVDGVAEFLDDDGM